jgi:hypothetical protein
VLLTEGPSNARRAAGLAVSVPAQATQAYLTGVHALSPDAARRAGGRANLETALGAFGLIALVGVLIAAALRY